MSGRWRKSSRKKRSTMSANLEDLDDVQYDTLKQLKKKVSDVLPPDYPDVRLIKWLRSHSYSLKKTESAFRANRRLREVYQFDTIAQTYVKPEAVAKYEFASSLGIAKNGSPVRYTRFGNGDKLGFMMALSGYDICLYCSYLMEYDLEILRRENEKSGRQVDEVTYVIDMEGFSLQQLMLKGAIETGLDLLQMMQDHYPEMWGNIFVVNAPSYFERAFNIFKPIMRLTMLQKIRVASRESSPALLLKYIHEDELPVFLGGKKTDSSGDPLCSEFINFGGTVPEEYFLRNIIEPLCPTDEGVTSVWVAARSVYNHTLVVEKPDSRLRVEYRTENGGISIKMLYRPFPAYATKNFDLPAHDEYLDESRESSNVLYVSPAFRMQSHTTPIDQRVRAPWPGLYIFRFDNTYSWFTSRQIIYRIRILQDDSQ